jgi:hypothetical protein
MAHPAPPPASDDKRTRQPRKGRHMARTNETGATQTVSQGTSVVRLVMPMPQPHGPRILRKTQRVLAGKYGDVVSYAGTRAWLNTQLVPCDEAVAILEVHLLAEDLDTAYLEDLVECINGDLALTAAAHSEHLLEVCPEPGVNRRLLRLHAVTRFSLPLADP